jgi:flagella basal body P-ring formation protein FlgA
MGPDEQLDESRGDAMNNSNSSGSRGARRIPAALALAAILPFGAAAAQTPVAPAVPDPPERSVHMLLERETAGIQGRAEIVVGQLDPRLTLAPCSRIEPFLPVGTRAWGRINVGMRCREGAAWTVFLPVTVSVFGTALTARKALMFGATLADNDVEAVEGELSREPGTPVSDLKQIEGRVLARALFPGQILRVEHFRAAPVIAQGDQVRLVANGPGFTISADGEALAQALEGQSVRVKAETGRIVSGIARPGRIVELRY